MRGLIFHPLKTYPVSALEYPVTPSKQTKNFTVAWLQRALCA
jgi:hypothetical protein